MKATIAHLIVACAVVGAAAAAETAPDIKAGETKTGAPGTNAKVTSRKKGSTYFFDFQIPKGTKGDPGAQGPVGPQGAQGPQGVQGPPGSAADRSRSIYIPGGSLTYSGAGASMEQYGLRLTQTAAARPTFVIPQPPDWDKTTPITVTLHFSITNTTSSNSVVNWRLLAGTVNTNLPETDKDTGWDTLESWDTEDAASLLIPAVPGRWQLSKSQSWTSKFSNTYSTWYFGSSVTTNNDFSNDPLWRFSFQRGSAAGNGESFNDTLTINAVSVNYTAK